MLPKQKVMMCGCCAQIPVRRPENLETTSLGAAFAAGIGSGFWTREWVLHGDHEDHFADEFLPKVCSGFPSLSWRHFWFIYTHPLPPPTPGCVTMGTRFL
jgi:hypothetical protein